MLAQEVRKVGKNEKGREKTAWQQFYLHLFTLDVSYHVRAPLRVHTGLNEPGKFVGLLREPLNFSAYLYAEQFFQGGEAAVRGVVSMELNDGERGGVSYEYMLVRHR